MSEQKAMPRQDAQYLDMRMRQYHEDSFIKGCLDIMRRIVQKAQPYAIVNMKTLQTEFDIDEKTKTDMKWWKQKMEEYILSTYPDIIYNPETPQ